MKHLLPVFVVLVLLLPASATSQIIPKEFEAYYRGDYATALQELRPLAEQGEAGAQYSTPCRNQVCNPR